MNQNATSNFFLDQAIDLYTWTLQFSDNRTKGWTFVDSPIPTTILTITYLFIVWIGPRLMRNRKPFDLKHLLIVYNMALASLNFYIAYELLIASNSLKYNYICEPCREIYSDDEMRIANAVWWFYISKCLEFSDTFFFIFRKKTRQLSFLHVYHHSTMFPLWWIGVKYVPTGSTFLPAMVNSWIHTIMYSYYGFSALGPNVIKYLWWKKYLTILQLIQFVVALVLGMNAIRSSCGFPLWMPYALVIYMISFIVLFGKFYGKMYLEKMEPIGNEQFTMQTVNMQKHQKLN